MLRVEVLCRVSVVVEDARVCTLIFQGSDDVRVHLMMEVGRKTQKATARMSCSHTEYYIAMTELLIVIDTSRICYMQYEIVNYPEYFKKNVKCVVLDDTRKQTSGTYFVPQKRQTRCLAQCGRGFSAFTKTPYTCATAEGCA